MTKDCFICGKKYGIEHGLSLHQVPRDVPTKKKWLNIMGIDIHGPSDLSVYTYICANHFSPEDFFTTPSGKRCLKKGTVPQISSAIVKELRLEPSGQRPINSTYANESEKENIIIVENPTKASISPDVSDNSANNPKLVENLYTLSPQIEVTIKSEDDENDLIIEESAEEWVPETSDTNRISPTAENCIDDESEDDVNVPTEAPTEETVLEISDTNRISPTAENDISDESEDDVNVPTENPREKTIQECISDSATLTAFSDDPFATDNPSDAEEAASSTSIVSKTHLAFEKNVANRRHMRYFGDCTADDLDNPSLARTSWRIITKTISEQKAKIRNLQTQNRRLKSKIQSLNSLLTYLFQNYEFQKKS